MGHPALVQKLGLLLTFILLFLLTSCMEGPPPNRQATWQPPFAHEMDKVGLKIDGGMEASSFNPPPFCISIALVSIGGFD